MEIDIEPGRYVVAVSGGVDSVALLHLLQGRPDVELLVAHYDHGIRQDSAEDRQLVQRLAQSYGLPFHYAEGQLGMQASEATARNARYAFLRQVAQAEGAAAIITAHHQDDLLETLALNMARGTGRRGLSSLRSTNGILRPLLAVTKEQLLRYAQDNELTWREDSTNSDERYLRNYIRRQVMPRLTPQQRAQMVAISSRMAALNMEICQALDDYLGQQPSPNVLDRQQFILLPHLVAREVLAEWLLHTANIELSRALLERLVVAAKTGRSGTKTDVQAGYWLEISLDTLALRQPER